MRIKMDGRVLLDLLDRINGCTFASLDAETVPSPGLRKTETGKRIILFKSPHYSDIVRRRLVEAGKNPDDFALGDLPWGSRIEGTPLIENKGKIYLQVIELAEGKVEYRLFNGTLVNPSELMLRSTRTNQGLGDNGVHVRAYNIDNITRIALLGEVLVADAKDRAVLKISA
jgi:hypothetical protein